MILRRLLFVVVYILWLPFSFIAMVLLLVSIITIGPIVWIITGDEDKVMDIAFNGLPTRIISVPYKILNNDGYRQQI